MLLLDLINFSAKFKRDHFSRKMKVSLCALFVFSIIGLSRQWEYDELYDGVHDYYEDEEAHVRNHGSVVMNTPVRQRNRGSFFEPRSSSGRRRFPVRSVSRFSSSYDGRRPTLFSDEAAVADTVKPVVTWEKWGKQFGSLVSEWLIDVFHPHMAANGRHSHKWALDCGTSKWEELCNV